MDTLDMYNYHPRDYEVRAHPEPEMARNKRLSTPGYFTSTKGHSVLRNKWGYGGRAMSPVDDLYLSDVYRPRNTSYYDTTGTENEIRRNVNRELLFSSHAADDAFDVAAKSRNRDQEILREATNAIVNTETHASPKAAVAARRARSHSHFTYHHPTAAPKSYLPPPKTTTISTPSYSYVRRPRKEVVVVSSLSRPRPASATDSFYRVYTKRAAMADWYPSSIPTIPHYNPWWRYYTAANQLNHSYYPIRSPRVIKTVCGPKVSSAIEMYSNYFSVFPSRFVYPARYRLYDYDYPAFHRKTARFLAIPLVYKRKYVGKSTTSTRGGKAIRAVDGYTQPKNILSWQYRIDSRVDPEDVIQMPKTYEAVRKQMKDVQCRMDKHRQLMDRYLEPDLKPETEDVKSKIMNLYVDMEQRNPSLFRATGESVTSSSTEHREISTSVRATSVRPPPVSFNPAIQYHRDDSEFPPMSDVRRRVRSVIRKNKRAASVL
ncbi:uncharacterized protein LOC110446328 isoform X12 [Mizuhopecten yessoensis]|uniref:uncharacterized protein LOC110446328 isoform X12 n=1 Tax=Mizuhopecten yessoensis TaxID=6573 RepID=UPI000B458DE9|nr:uncharacterized protein LOC110446328 isoform X12 [Mizuhopecten yessoensis]